MATEVRPAVDGGASSLAGMARRLLKIRRTDSQRSRSPYATPTALARSYSSFAERPPTPYHYGASAPASPVDLSVSALSISNADSCPDLSGPSTPPPTPSEEPSAAAAVVGSEAWLCRQTRWYARLGAGAPDPLSDLYGLAPCVKLLYAAVQMPHARPDKFRGALEPRHFLHLAGRPGSGLRALVERACQASGVNCCVVDGDVELPPLTFTRMVAHARAHAPIVFLLDRLDGAWTPPSFHRFGAELFAAWKASGLSPCDPATGRAASASPSFDFFHAWFVCTTQAELQTLDPYFQRAVSTARAEPVTGLEAFAVAQRAAVRCLESLGVPDDRPSPDRLATLNLARSDVLRGDAVRLAADLRDSRMASALRRLDPLLRSVSSVSDGQRADGVATPSTYSDVVFHAFTLATENCLAARRNLDDVDARVPTAADFDAAVRVHLPGISVGPIGNGSR